MKHLLFASLLIISGQALHAEKNKVVPFSQRLELGKHPYDLEVLSNQFGGLRNTWKMLLDNYSKIVVDFHNPYCSTCNFFAVVFADVAAKYLKDVLFIKANIGVKEIHELSIPYGLNTIPYTIVLQNGERIHTIAGMRDTAQLHQELLTAFNN